MKKLFVLTLIFSFLFDLAGQSSHEDTSHYCPMNDVFHTHEYQSYDLSFIENKNQWQDNINFAVSLGGLNQLFLEDKSFTYVLYDQETSDNIHELIQLSDEEIKKHSISGHAYKVNFLNAIASNSSGSLKRNAFNNYFLGSDKSKWASNVPVYNQVHYDNIYKGIELAIYSHNNNLKYDFIVAPQEDPNQIQLQFEGTDSLYLENGNLVIETSVGNLKEMAPYAYQNIRGKQVKVNCQYHLTDKVLSYQFPNGYRKDLPLIIDPELVGATLSGSSSTNFGHSATFDNQGNIYTAGISFGIGYPVTTGAFQLDFGGGEVDYAISKYNTDGSQLLYATYIGGSEPDYPHSIICDANGELYIYGTTSSSNFPVTANALQPDFGGIVDIAITRLNASGSTLIGSTYMGGSRVDGRNNSNFNFIGGDRFRGEIVLDAFGDVYISSGSASEDFPVTPNAFQTTNNTLGIRKQDGVVFKLKGDLSAPIWSTYLGSDSEDFCNALRLDDLGNVYVVGVAGNANFPVGSGGIQPNWPGGMESSFILHLSSDGSRVLNGSFWGTPQLDRAYFIDLDNFGQVHIYGLSRGVIPISPNTYSFGTNANQFLSAFSKDLSQLIYSTSIGTDNTSRDLVPVAFLVDNCNKIYFSGYHARVGLPVTPDAFSTEGDAFYIGILEENATDLNFGTYYRKANHVDGGTSRFDKNGVIYQCVCSCDQAGSDNTMETTPNAWATDQVSRCDVGVFKIDLESKGLTALGYLSPSNKGCPPFEVDFFYTGLNAESLFWDFGNGDNSTETNPTYTYTEPGVYMVTQIATNLNSCNIRDTFHLQIEVIAFADNAIDTTSCIADNIWLNASVSGATYLWQDNSTTPFFQAKVSGNYWVDIMLGECMQRDFFSVTIGNEVVVDFEVSNTGCNGDSLGFIKTNNLGESDTLIYLWSNGSKDTEISNVAPGPYNLTITNEFGCSLEASFIINTVDELLFDVEVLGSNCEEDLSNAQINIFNITGGTPPYLFSLDMSSWTNTQLYDNLPSGNYEIFVEDNIGCLASQSIDIFSPEMFSIDAGPDIEIVLGDSVLIYAQVTSQSDKMIDWFPPLYLDCTDCLNPITKPFDNITYTLTVTDSLSGCIQIDDVNVTVDKERKVYIPNSFSPNRDGINDEFFIFSDDSVARIKSFQIFNRWGGLVFINENIATNDPSLGWDGKYKNEILSSQVLVYVAEIEFIDGLTLLYKGDLTLIQ